MFNPPLAALTACLHSVRSQSFTDWEWWLVDDASTQPEVALALDAAAADDARLRVIHRPRNGGIVAASNDALASATGEFVVLLDHDDAIAPDALRQVVVALDASVRPVDYLYTDETHVLLDGTESIPFHKPDWSPERFRSSMYTCHLSVLRRSAIDEVGGFRHGFDGSQDHDLVLRVTERSAARNHAVVHLPIIGYHWRTVSSSVSRAEATVGAAVENGRRAVQEQCDRLGIAATVDHGPVPGTYRVRRRIDALRVTVVVPTTFEPAVDRPHRLAVRATTTGAVPQPHATAEVTWVIAHPQRVVPEIYDLATDGLDERWQLVPVAGEWSLAAAVERASLAHPGDVYVVLAPGISPSTSTPDWLDALVGLAASGGAGMVSGLIHDTDHRVVHAGWDVPAYRRHLLEGRPVGATTTGNDLLIERECTHVTLAAAAFTHEVWQACRGHAVGPFDDAGFGMSGAALLRGRRNLVTPYARFCRDVPVRGSVTRRRG